MGIPIKRTDVTQMSEMLLTHCPHCGRSVRLALGSVFRCRHHACDRTFSLVEVRPRPTEYGITEQQVGDLKAPIAGVPAWFTAAFLLFAVILWWASEQTWLFFVSCALSFLFVGLIDKLVRSVRESSRKNDPLYPIFRRYEEALDKYSRFVDAAHRQREEQLRAKETWWKELDGRDFEKELAHLFEARGFDVRWTGRAGDEGVDIFLRRDGKLIIVQCKAQKNYVSPGAVRDLYGALLHHHADEAWLIVTSGFHNGSKSFAAGKPICLLTIRNVLEATKEV